MTPKILLPMNLRNKIQFIVDNCDKEVSGLGTVVFDKEENAYRVTDICLLDQEVGAAHTDIDDNAVAQAVYETRDAEGELAFWWHSHVNMDVFWSGTDRNTMESIGKNGLCVAVVFNKKDEMRGAIVMAPKNYPAYTIDDVEIEIEYEYDFDTEGLLAEMKEKVREKKWTQHTYPNYSDQYNKDDKNTNLNDRIVNPKGFGTDLRKLALDDWSKMSKTERKRWIDFEDFLEEAMWGEYVSTDSENKSVMM